jgi:hypothetical protein
MTITCDIAAAAPSGGQVHRGAIQKGGSFAVGVRQFDDAGVGDQVEAGEAAEAAHLGLVGSGDAVSIDHATS